jgi:hypothetical protein
VARKASSSFAVTPHESARPSPCANAGLVCAGSTQLEGVAADLRGRAHAAARHAAPDRRVCTLAHAVKTRAPEHPCCLHSKGRALDDRLRAAHAQDR